MDVKSWARKSISFNNSKKIENCDLSKVEEEESTLAYLKEVSFLDSEQSDFNLNLVQVLGTESSVKGTIQLDDIQLEAPEDNDDNVHQKVSIFSSNQSACSSIVASSKLTKSTY